MLLTVSLLCIVTFIAGLIDSIAGGGGLLRLPALLIAGGLAATGPRHQQSSQAR